jgi:ribose transport system permease protein
MDAKLTHVQDGPVSSVLPLGARRRARIIDFFGRFGLVIAWAIVIAIFGVFSPHSFLTWANFTSMFGSQAVLVVVTCGLLLPLRAGDYDLSLAGTMALSSMTLAALNADMGVNVWWCVAIVVAIGLTAGLVNGIISTSLAIDPFIVTLGVGTVCYGFAYWVSGSQTISGVSTSLVGAVVGTRIFKIPIEFYYGVALVLAQLYLFEFTSIGRRLLFVGKGRDVARLSGIPTNRIRIGAFTVAGLLSALAGVMYDGTFGGADPAAAQSYLMPAFASAFLGSTAISPGFFNPIGTFIAVYFLQTGISGLAILHVETYVQNLFYGTALIVAVALSQVAKRSLIKGRDGG